MTTVATADAVLALIPDSGIRTDDLQRVAVAAMTIEEFWNVMQSLERAGTIRYQQYQWVRKETGL